MLRERWSPPRDLFPAEPWALRLVRLDREAADQIVAQTETMFALANGHLGIRGTFDEGRPVAEPGVFLNGFYEHRPITYGEHAYGFPRMGQSMLNCPDATIIRVSIDGEPFVATMADISSFERRLDMRRGILDRDIVWSTAQGKRARLRTSRLVSFVHRELAAISWELTLDADAEVVVSSEIVSRDPLPLETTDPRLAPELARAVLRPIASNREALRAMLIVETERSGLRLGCGIDHAVECASPWTASSDVGELEAAVVFNVSARAGEPIRLWKYMAYHYGNACSAADGARVGSSLDRAAMAGFAHLVEGQQAEVSRFWAHADVEVDSAHPHAQQVIRWNLFQLLQASQRAEGHGIGARGLTGRTYEGHYFWDTEIYVLPFLVYTQPALARNVLMFRYRTLEKARARAAELGHRGATFPWRTINGDEASAYYAAGTAQYHINADIAYAIRKYVEVSGDKKFLENQGAEILVETARLWRDLGFFSERHGGNFCINGVTGPDEYNAVVDNNYFTNLMARENLRYAAEVVRKLQATRPGAYRELVNRTALEEGEIEDWDRAAVRMYLPYDDRLQIHPQDDGFLDKKIWDFANTPEDHYPLLLHYHPLNLYRSQVLKQADTVLAMFLLGDEFSSEEKKRNFDYYDPLTTHDSSLSVCIQSIVANEIGYRRKALEYFRFAAVMDLSDVGGNMKHGAHVASIGGTWLALVYGFGGLRDYGGRISFRPCLPQEWSALRFPLAIRGRRLRVEIEHATTTYRLVEGSELRIWHGEEELVLTAAAPIAIRPTPAPPVEEPEPGPGAVDPAVEDDSHPTIRPPSRA
jgi:alpha,alpha-trehalose phosphorylase